MPGSISALEPWMRQRLTRWRPILSATLVVAAVGLAATLYCVDYRPDQQTDSAAARAAVRAASDGAVALLSYSPDSLSRDIDNAKSRLTADFQTSYQLFAEQIVAPTAQRGRLTTTASVIRAAAVELQPNWAVVLVFLSQRTASAEKPEAVRNTVSLRVSLTKVQGSWLISKLENW